MDGIEYVLGLFCIFLERGGRLWCFRVLFRFQQFPALGYSKVVKVRRLRVEVPPDIVIRLAVSSLYQIPHPAGTIVHVQIKHVEFLHREIELFPIRVAVACSIICSIQI